MHTWSLTKTPKIYNGWKKASSKNGAGVPGCLYVEEWKETHICHLVQSSGPSRSRTSTGENLNYETLSSMVLKLAHSHCIYSHFLKNLNLLS